jgi:DNA-binding NtrC family response regulator
LPADFRLVAATHRDLRAMVQAETFRRDLYYRINTFPLHTPALHERAEDIPLLAASLLERVDRRPGRRLTSEALAWLTTRRYAGNIRELRNLIERATLLADGDLIDLPHLMEMDDELPFTPPSIVGGFQLNAVVDLATLEKSYLAWARAGSDGNLESLAKQLGVSQRTLYRKLQGGN